MNEGHQRFQDWLTAGAEGDPPRDLAVHASLCDGCQRSIGALDHLAIVNTGWATMPGEPTGRERSPLMMAGRLVGATAVLFSAAVLGVGVSQLIGVSRPAGPVAQASRSPNQGVLGATATPQPSTSGEALPSVAGETLSPLGTPLPTHAPTGTPVPHRTPRPTPFATFVATPVPSATVPPNETPVPTPVPTPAPTPVPTPIPTPAPTIPDPPFLSSSVGAASGEIDLSWSTPNDGGDPISGYEVYFADGSPAGSVAFGTNSLTVPGLTPGGSYSFYVIARNSIGPSGASNTVTETAGL